MSPLRPKTASTSTGKKKWRHRVNEVVQQFKTAVQVGYVALGGGNARLLKKLPPGTQLGNNADVFEGGYRLWTMLYNGSTHERFVHEAKT